MVKLGSSIVLLVTILCGVQQFSPVFCDECNTLDCILSEILSYIPFMSSSAYEEYYDGDYYDDYYYDNLPVTTEEIIIIPLTPSAPEPFFPSFSGETYDSAISSPSPSAYEDYYYNEGESGLSGYDYAYESASATSGQESESSLMDDILGFFGIRNSTSGTALNASAPSSFSSSATDGASSASGSGNSSSTPASSLSGSASSWDSGSATEASATTTNSASAASALPSASSSASDDLSNSGSAASAPVSSVSGSASGVSSGSSGSPVSASASSVSGSASANLSGSGSATTAPISSATDITSSPSGSTISPNNTSASASASDFNPLGMFGTSGDQIIVN